MDRLIIPDICNGSVSARIDQENWQEFRSSGVSCHATLSHDEDTLLVLFDVTEPQILADCTQINDHVCDDSCVELFLQNPAISQEYVNFEFSASGACHVARGLRRQDRVLYSSYILEKLEVKVSRFEGSWRLYCCIPLCDYGLLRPGDYNGQILKANMYKCGDKLRQPHYLSWTRIDTPRPDFHCPEFFGEFVLE